MPIPHVFAGYPAGNFQASDWDDDFNYVNNLATAAANYVPPYTGGISRTTTSKFSDVISILDFGAQASGGAGTDCTLAIQAAINACPFGGAVYIPSAPTSWSYRCIGAGSAIFTINKPITILGDGYGSGIFVDPSVPSTRDVFHIVPSGSGNGYSFHDFSIGFGGSGRHGLHFDISASTTILLINVSVDHVQINASAGGNSIKLTNNAGTTTGGIAYSVIQRCNLESVLLGLAGDGILISNNVIGAAGSNVAVQAGFTAGAGGFVVANNVITALNGHVILTDGVSPNIANNEFETPVSVTNTYGFLVDLGTTGAMQAPRLTGNSYSVLTGTSNPIPIRVRGNSSNAIIADNRSSVQTGGTHIQVDAGAADTSIERNTQFLVNNAVTTPVVSTAGTRTGWVQYLGDGTSGTPALSFLSEKTLGLYRSGSGVMGLQGALSVSGALSGASVSAGSFGAALYLAGYSLGVNLNSANTDTTINMTLPTGAGFTRYRIAFVLIAHSSASLTTATAGLFTASGGGGTAIVTNVALSTITTASENTAGNMFLMTVNNQGTTSYNLSSLFFRVGTAQGSAATADVYVYINPLV